MFLCMIIIVGFEYAGLVNREKNLEFRQSFVKGICKIEDNLAINHVFSAENKQEQQENTIIPEFKTSDYISKEKEMKKQFMTDLLLESAVTNGPVLNEIQNSLPEVNEFFD